MKPSYQNHKLVPLASTANYPKKHGVVILITKRITVITYRNGTNINHGGTMVLL